MQVLLKIDNLIEGQIIKRPSKYIKTPYVADILYENEEVLGHTASLGCCGLADVNAIVLMTLSPESKIKSKPNTDPAFQAALKSVREKEAKKTPEQRKAELDDYKARQMNR